MFKSLKSKIIGGFSLLLLCFIVWFLFPSNNGMNHYDKFAKHAETNLVCEYAGFLNFRKKDLQQVFARCEPKEQLKGELNTAKQIVHAISEQMIMPHIDATPTKENVSFVFITMVQENVVLCTEILKQKIIRSWSDSYENYCIPE